MDAVLGRVAELGRGPGDLRGDAELLGVCGRASWRRAGELDVGLAGTTGDRRSAHGVSHLLRVEANAVLGGLDPGALAIRVPHGVLRLTHLRAQHFGDGRRQDLRRERDRCLAIDVAHHHGVLERGGRQCANALAVGVERDRRRGELDGLRGSSLGRCGRDGRLGHLRLEHELALAIERSRGGGQQDRARRDRLAVAGRRNCRLAVGDAHGRVARGLGNHAEVRRDAGTGGGGDRRRDVGRVGERQEQRRQAAGLHRALDGASDVDPRIELGGVHLRRLRVQRDGNRLVELRRELVLELQPGILRREPADIDTIDRHARSNVALHRQAAHDHQCDQHEHHEHDDATVACALAGTPRRGTVHRARAGAGAGL